MAVLLVLVVVCSSGSSSGSSSNSLNSSTNNPRLGTCSLSGTYVSASIWTSGSWVNVRFSSMVPFFCVPKFFCWMLLVAKILQWLLVVVGCRWLSLDVGGCHSHWMLVVVVPGCRWLLGVTGCVAVLAKIILRSEREREREKKHCPLLSSIAVCHGMSLDVAG